MSFRVRPVAGTTHRGYDLANILQERVRDGSPKFRIRVVAVMILQGYDSSNFPLLPVSILFELKVKPQVKLHDKRDVTP